MNIDMHFESDEPKETFLEAFKKRLNKDSVVKEVFERLVKVNDVIWFADAVSVITDQVNVVGYTKTVSTDDINKLGADLHPCLGEVESIDPFPVMVDIANGERKWFSSIPIQEILDYYYSK